MAPTTMLNQKTSTTPRGRDQKRDGFPLKVCELLSVLPGVFYAERVSVHDPKNVLKTKKAIKKIFQNQIDNKGFSIVEVLSPCPTYWGLSSKESVKWIDKVMVKEYPLGVYTNRACN